jgi:hypothetical protein
MNDFEQLEKFAEERAKNHKVCKNCGWFAVRKDEKVGECHRYPPSHATMADEEWRHPITSQDNVCGEFVHNRTGDSFQPDPYRAIAVRLARAEDELARLRSRVIHESRGAE